MPRQSSPISVIEHITHDLLLAQRQKDRADARRRRELSHEQAEVVREDRAKERDQHDQHVREAVAGVGHQNEALSDRVSELQSLLVDGLRVDRLYEIAALKQPYQAHPFVPEVPVQPSNVPVEASFMPPPPGVVHRLFGRAEHQRAVLAGQQRFIEAVAAYEREESKRITELARERTQYDEQIRVAQNEATKRDAQIDAWQADLNAGQPDAVADYFYLVLLQSAYPEKFPMQFAVGYRAGARELAVNYHLPTATIIPTSDSFHYYKSSDAIRAHRRPAPQIRAMYSAVLAQVALRTVCELFQADRGRYVDEVAFNGVVDGTDPQTGLPVQHCLVSVDTTAAVFARLRLDAVDPVECLTGLGGRLSPNPLVGTPVQPLRELSALAGPGWATSVGGQVIEEHQVL